MFFIQLFQNEKSCAVPRGLSVRRVVAGMKYGLFGARLFFFFFIEHQKTSTTLVISFVIV